MLINFRKLGNYMKKYKNLIYTIKLDMLIYHIKSLV